MELTQNSFNEECNYTVLLMVQHLNQYLPKQNWILILKFHRVFFQFTEW